MKLKASVGLRSEELVREMEKELVREMERMEEPSATDPKGSGVTGDLGSESRNMYYDLTMLTTGTSLNLIKGVGNNTGLVEYRQLCRRWHAGTRRRNLARLQSILHRNFGTIAAETLDNLAASESEIEEWDQLTGEKMADSIKFCVLDPQAPRKLSTSLRLHIQAGGDLRVSEDQDSGLPAGHKPVRRFPHGGRRRGQEARPQQGRRQGEEQVGEAGEQRQAEQQGRRQAWQREGQGLQQGTKRQGLQAIAVGQVMVHRGPVPGLLRKLRQVGTS